MIHLTHPLKLQLFQREGDERLRTIVAPLRPAEFAFAVNAAKVAFGKQCWGGLGVPGPLDAWVRPLRRCACQPRSEEEATRMRELGCLVEEYEVELRRGAAPVFTHRQPMERLAPLASGVLGRLGLSAGGEGAESCLWRLTADFLTPLPEANGGLEPGFVELDDPEPQPLPAWAPRPAAMGDNGSLGQGGNGEAGEPAALGPGIFVHADALDDMVGHAREAPADLEVGGALIGRLARDATGLYAVVEAAPLLTTSGTACTVTFGWQAFHELRRLRAREAEQGVLLGLFHVHPASFETPFASQQDIFGFSCFWDEPWHLFAVVGRSVEQTAFFAWRPDGSVGAAAYSVVAADGVQRGQGERGA